VFLSFRTLSGFHRVWGLMREEGRARGAKAENRLP